jgi:hypothetical protein
MAKANLRNTSTMKKGLQIRLEDFIAHNQLLMSVDYSYDEIDRNIERVVKNARG